MASSEASVTKSIITGLLASNPLRCTLDQFCKDFRNIVGYNIPFRKLGFSSVEEYLRSISDTVRIFGNGPSAEIQGVITEKSAHINIMVAKQKKDSIPANKRKNIKVLQNPKPQTLGRCANAQFEDDYKSRIPKRIQNNLRKLIMRFPNGIWCTKLRSEYFKMFKEDLNYEKFHFRSLIEMCTDLTEIFQYVQPRSDDFILYDRNNAVPCLNQNDESVKNEKSHEVLELDWSLGSRLIPDDVVQFLEEIPQFNLDDLKVGEQLDINIGEIYNTSKFFVYPKYGDFDTVKAELGKHFHNDRNRYVIPDIFQEKGLYCTVYHNKEYYRCVIVDLLPNKHLKVLFIDVGSIGEVSTKNVWYLPKKLAIVPSQAIKARLSNVKSIGVETVDKFIQLIKRADLVAEIMKIDKQKGVLDIYLANITNTESIFFVNDALVEKGYAKYC